VIAGPARGFRLIIEPRKEKYYWRGAHEPAVTKAMTRLLKPGQVFWDIGAHIGYISLIGSRLVGSTGHVHAFEPMPANAKRLGEAVRLNTITNLTVHQVAVSDSDRPDVLHGSEATSMWSLLRQDHVGVPIICVTLDAMLALLGPPNLIKIDVEGAELGVLMGAERLLSLHPTLIMELLTDANRTRAEALLAGRTFERLDRSNWLVRGT